MKASVKLLLVISAIVLVIGSATGTLLYFFVFQDGGNYTIQSSGYVRAAENNQTITNAEIQLYGRKEDKSFKLLETTYTDNTGYYSISKAFWVNTTIVRESYFKIVASTSEEIYDHEFYSDLGNYTTDFLLAEIGILESEGRLFPKRNDSHLTYTFVSVLPLTSDAPRLTATIGCNASGSALLEIYDNNQLVKSLTISNNGSHNIDIQELDVTIVHSVKLKLIPTDTVHRLWELDHLELTNLVWNQKINKVAVVITPIIWANDDYNNRKSILRDFGFNIRHYKSPSVWEPIFTTLDTEEDENSIVFILISGHGNYVPSRDNGTGDSFVNINPDINLFIYSSDLRPFIDNLESKRILIMAESCNSGGFIDDFTMNGVSMLTAADKDHTSNTNFGFYFFKGVNESKMDDMDAFDFAASKFDGYLNQIANPQANWRSWHSFFYP